MNWEKQRAAMVELQLRGRDIRSHRVLKAMGTVPRHEFVPDEYRAESYADGPLPIGSGQTISQPYIVALMTELSEAAPGHRTLEIGTGCGYQAAVLAACGAEVFSIEIVEELCVLARSNLGRLGIDVNLRCGDGYAGWPEAAPFDSIVVTAAPRSIPAPLLEQLAEGGRMVIPIGDSAQNLELIYKTAGKPVRNTIIPVRFVPMTGQARKKN